MAKERNPARRKTVNESVHALGVRGRKTGIELPDTGVRDEHGMEPLEHLFSSPERPVASRPEPGNETIDEEMDMDIESPNAGPAPSDFLQKNNPKTRLPPRARSPPRTSFNSPPIRHPGLVSSSPGRNTLANQSSSSPPFQSAAVKRKLTFSARTKLAPPTNGYYAHANGAGRVIEEESEEDDDDSVLRANGDSGMGMNDDSMAMVGDAEGPAEEEQEEEGEEEEEEEEPVGPKLKGRVGRPRKQQLNPDPEPEQQEEEPSSELPKARRRLKGKRPAEEPIGKPAKKRRSLRNSLDGKDQAPEPEPEAEPESESEPAPKRAKSEPTHRARGRPKVGNGTSAPGTSKLKEPKKSKGRPKADDVGEESVLIQQAPPLPKKAGLAIMRHDEDSLKTTRFGRHSYKPVEFWRGERVVTDKEYVEDPTSKRKIVVQSVSEVVRVARPSPPRKSRHKRKPGPVGRRRREASYDSEDELPRERWESESGKIAAEVVMWEREHEKNPPAADDPVSMREEDVAISSSAIVTREIRDATFKFTKTLTTPYFGTGVVDLPPGSEKRPKNARKMHMAFFVHTGMVKVTVNETTFGIGAGGQWFVPRGNYYSIENDTDRDARIFFAQACEVNPPEEE